MQKLISSPHAEQSPISRDKIAVSRRRGIWVGGPVPLGYASINKKLVMAPEDERHAPRPTADIVVADKAAPFGSKGITDIATRVFGSN
jgi:hypothetical protein